MYMMRYFLILLFFFTFAGLAFAQKTISPRFASEQALSQHLNQLLLEQQSINLLAPFDDLSDSPSIQSALFLAIARVKGENSPSLASTLDRIEQRRKIKPVNREEALALEAKYLELNRKITPLRQLRDLLSDDTQEDHVLREELAFYQLSSGLRMAELGAGDPTFAKQVLSQLRPQQYYLNDIDPAAVQIIRDFFHLWPVQVPATPILGESRSTGLEGQDLDVIIIRNALHHFNELPAMLTSIKASLAPEGRLFIKETFFESCYGLCCPDIRPEAELLQALEQAGFELLRRSAIHETSTTWHLLEYSTSPKAHH
jgi:SAM-dependent methyltransferase